ncbi:MAG TPA: heavy metal translocating P-type ATPase [Casimicrobiaceae bacterium]|nr:heavy metal translocating P-type ATPase [Casimicrobiaceae bacterium]
MLASDVIADAAPAAHGPGALCFHCGEPALPGSPRLHLEGIERAFCCAGCAAVAQIIHGAGLDQFYAQRSTASDRFASREQEFASYDVAGETAGWVRHDAEGMCSASLLVEGIHCAACVWLIEQYVGARPGVVEASVNLVTRRARVRWHARDAKLSDVLRAVHAIGYRAHPYDPARREQLARSESRRLLLRAGVALLAMMQVMMFAIPAYVSSDGVEPQFRALLDWASLLITAPVVFYCAMPFFAGALRDLRARRLGMDVPVALGVAAAFAASAWATLANSGAAVYYDSVTMFVALLLTARFVEHRAREKAADAIEAMSHESPATAERMPGYPGARVTQTVPVQGLRAGDIVEVAVGATIPVDGDVVEGTSSVEEAVLTGESRPCRKFAGDRVLAGSINRESPLAVRVRAIGEATVLAAIARMIEDASTHRPRAARIADRAASWFVAMLLMIAAASGIAWWVIEPSRAFEVVLAVLVVSCPCALSLATPAALAAASATLSRNRIVAVRKDALETLARVTHVVFDKTGTLTTGALRLVHVESFGRMSRTCVAVAAALEQGMAHPVARALCEAAPDHPEARDVIASPGNGVEGTIAGCRYRLGRPGWVAELSRRGASEDSLMSAHISSVVLGDARGPIARFDLSDELRPAAASLVDRLKADAIGVSMISGDRTATVLHFAARAGIDDAFGDTRPEDKRAYIRDLQRNGAVVAMIGDGVNDAPAMAQADVSISLGNAANLTRWTADVALLSEDIAHVADALDRSRRAFRAVRQNLVWALAYNLVAIPLAATGFLTPVVAAVGMSTSSLFVVGNALRLLRRDHPTRCTHVVRAQPAPIASAV